jgi:hypothetical protein
MIRAETASACLYSVGNRKLPKLQILTAEVIDCARPQTPFGRTESLKKAARESTTGRGAFYGAALFGHTKDLIPRRPCSAGRSKDAPNGAGVW